MTMRKEEKYLKASKANFTADDWNKFHENRAFVAKRFPEQHAHTMEIMKEKSLEYHREVVQHYVKYRSPISEHDLGIIQAFADTTYAGPYGRGEQYEAPSTTPQGAEPSAIDNIFRKAIGPDGAK